MLLALADYALFLFHTSLVLFNCTGWIWRRTRRWHLATLAATATSWVILGIWFGPGYCVCTDLHWRVRAALGQHVTEQTYIQYLVARLTGWVPPVDLATSVTAAVFAFAVVLSLLLNKRDLSQARCSGRQNSSYTKPSVYR